MRRLVWSWSGREGAKLRRLVWSWNGWEGAELRRLVWQLAAGSGGDEVEAVCGESWRVRVADFSALGSGALLIVASVEYRDGGDSESSKRSSCSEEDVTGSL